MKILFIGAGKMATALAAGIVKHNIHSASELLAVDVFAPAREAFTKTTGIQCVENAADYVKEAETILLAVKPQVAPEAVAALPPLREGTLVISICAGIPLAKLSSWFHTEKIIRVMPNTPLMVGKGASCFALGAQADAACAKIAETILGSLGIARQVTEDQLDAVTALSGSGPAYFFEMVKAMADAGVHAGLSPELSLELTVQTLAGSAEMLCRKLGTPDELRDAV
ncbi:MAG: pyrroline-5-carboxylate reductase, partial [Victivallales bacterium]|nr:pyrroline-5-carboxylate reductase [Victivallales bacterium]